MNFPKLKKAIVAGVSVMAAAAIVLGAAGCGGGQKADDGKPAHVKLGYSPAVCNAALFAAYENGYFKEEGLDIELVQVDAAHISDAVGAGQVDAFQGMASKLVQPLENGLPVQAVSGMHTGCQKVLVPADSPIKTVADLKGKQVGVPGLADAGTILVKRAASREGISVTEKNMEIDFRVYSRNDLPQALQKGAVDAITASDPVGPIAAKEFGFRVLIDNAVTEPFNKEYCCLAFVTTKLAKENPKAAAAFVKAINRGALWVQQNPEKAAKLELDKKYVAGDLELVTSLLKSYNFNPSVKGGHDAIEAVAGELAKIGILKENTDGAKFAKEHFTQFEGVPDHPEK